MYFPEKEIQLKDGRTALLRSPVPEDAEVMLEYLRQTAAETHFLLREPEDVTMTVAQEEAFLRNGLESDSQYLILCYVDGKLAGNCQIVRGAKRKNCHRGSIGIALVKEFWGLGIGTAMFREMIAIAKSWSLLQLELEVVEGNDRAMSLYRKMGFETVGFTPNALLMPDGSYAKEFLMIKPL